MLHNIKAYVQKNLSDILKLYAVGLAMGTADIIPGVSGGTMAFIFGIYDELLMSIKICTGKVLTNIPQMKFRETIDIIPWGFLVPLFAGIGSAILALAHLMKYLLEHHPSFVKAFFFGLVLASIVIVCQRVKRWTVPYAIAGLATAVFAFEIVAMKPTQTSSSYLMFFFSGAIAICAMILPGISGSFLLLLMGKYHEILTALTQGEFGKLIVFALGCAVGIGLFSRVLTWALHRYHDPMISVLAGFMLGSLREIWPWHNIVQVGTKAEFGKDLFRKEMILPAQFDASVALIIFLVLVAIGIMIALTRILVRKESAVHSDF